MKQKQFNSEMWYSHIYKCHARARIQSLKPRKSFSASHLQRHAIEPEAKAPSHRPNIMVSSKIKNQKLIAMSMKIPRTPFLYNCFRRALALRRCSTIIGPLSTFSNAVFLAWPLAHHDNAQRSTSHAASGTRSAVARSLRPRHRIDHAPYFAENADSDRHNQSSSKSYCANDQSKLRFLLVIDEVAADRREDSAA
jgi:hypothetical protein